MPSLRQALAERRGTEYQPMRSEGAGRTRMVSERLEVDVCDVIGSALRARGYEVFFEVPLEDCRPDVVGFKGGRTVAVEAKLRDIKGVVKQGIRIADRFDASYLALPEVTANEAAFAVARIARRLEEQGRHLVLPGVLIVGKADVTLLRRPSGTPRHRLDPVRLRATAERFGAERGGLPSQDQLERNLAVWAAKASGASHARIAADFAMSPSNVRNVIARLVAWREHLGRCPGRPCVETDEDRQDFFAGAHKHDAALLALPPLP